MQSTGLKSALQSARQSTWRNGVTALHTTKIATAFCLLITALASGFAQADDPNKSPQTPGVNPPRPVTETLLPNVTKSFVSLPDFDQLRESFDKTELGKLANDPLMKPFIDDLDRQVDENLSQTDTRLGLTWEDIRGVYSGEICFASFQPTGGPKPLDNYSMAVLVDVKGKSAAVQTLLAKIETNMINQRKATRTEQNIDGADAIVYTLPKKRGVRIQRKAIVIVYKDWLLAIDHDELAADIVSRINGKAKTPSLAQVTAFQEVMKRTEAMAGQDPRHVRLFMEPIGMMEVSRAARRAGRRSRTRKTDRLAAFKKQGFAGVEGAGAILSFATRNQDIVYHGFIYCPSEKRVLAAKMLDFPNNGGAPPPWAPTDAATSLIVNWRLLNAFDALEPLVNEMMGDEVWEEIISSIEKDKNGPQINLRRDVVAHLKDRIALLTDVKQPITPDSELVAIAVELMDSAAVAASVKKAFKNDPFSKPIPYKGGTIYEISEPNANGRIVNDMSVVVHKEYLILASTSDYLKKLMDRESDNAFQKIKTYVDVESALKQLGANGDAARGFNDTRKSVRVNFELMRANKLPESKTMLARMLNNLWPTGDEAVKREPRIDGAKLPPFAKVEQYFLPSGYFVRSSDAGWSFAGVLLSQRQLAAKNLEAPAVEGADGSQDEKASKADSPDNKSDGAR